MRLSSPKVRAELGNLRAWAAHARWAEACLWAVGLAALGYCGFILAEAWVAQTGANRELDRSLHVYEVNVPPSRPMTRPALKPGALVGRIEVPRLRMSSVIFESFDDSVLRRGVGHLSGSALPGDPGNMVLAAHRDTFFRPLRNIRAGDTIEVTTSGGPRAYRVESTKVVGPNEVDVMNPTRDPELTLITCYPFEFFGHAPNRFIVIAKPIPDVAHASACCGELQLAVGNRGLKLTTAR